VPFIATGRQGGLAGAHGFPVLQKGEGQVVPRLGNSIKRVGFIGAMQGHRTAEDRVDYATNVKVIDVVFSVTS
jgi:hypothetical protein